MGYVIAPDQIDGILAGMSEKYRLYAPVRVKNSGKNIIRFSDISALSEIALDAQSDFSPKEIY